HDLLDRFQRIAVGADRLKPALNIEKARLPHDSLAPSAHGPLRSASQIRSDLARRIFQGAQELFYVDAALVGCGHVSGLLMRHGWPLALMLCADQVPIQTSHSKMC